MKCGLIGENISYSFSKEIHDKLNQRDPSKLNYDYAIFSIAKDAFDGFMHDASFDGLNVTIPYKKKSMDYCDTLSSLAKKIGAVNTLYHQNNALIGANTDYHGFSYLLDKAEISVEGESVLILGSGGAHETVKHVCKDRKASNITIASRNPDKARESFSSKDVEASGMAISFCDYEKIPRDVTVVINTTPLGTHPNYDSSPLDLVTLPQLKAAVDLIYNPLRTSFILQAMELGLKCSGGLAMLVAQAAQAREYFLSSQDNFASEQREDYNFERLDALCSPILKEIEREKENIVLIGMPGSGKTGMGKNLKKRLGRKFIDADIYLKQKLGKSPAQIIEQEGEDAFRTAESSCLKEISKEDGIIIATGGGAILREENMISLKHKGIIVYIDTPLDLLATKGRPLSKGGREQLEKLYKERAPLYEKWADITIKTSQNFMAAVSEVENLFTIQ